MRIVNGDLSYVRPFLNISYKKGFRLLACCGAYLLLYIS